MVVVSVLGGWISFIAVVMTSTESSLRRSRRLRGLQCEPFQGGKESDQSSESTLLSSAPPRKQRKTIERRTTKPKQTFPSEKPSPKSEMHSLPRSREERVLNESTDIQFVIGIDEAGRGPLAGPVVAAAIHLEGPCIHGIIDSKQIGEARREELYDIIVKSSSAVWAIAVIDAAMIDEINILQATLLGMRVAAAATIKGQTVDLPIRKLATADEKGCYVVQSKSQLQTTGTCGNVHALIDGNRLPDEMEFCSKECMVKGDGREYSIAAASILAKVTRDRIMREYSQLYPEYMLEQHKGYGTAAHMKAISKYGASPIHRLTFAPLKHMNLQAKDEEKSQ